MFEHLNFSIGLGLGILLTVLAAALKASLEKWISALFEQLPVFFGRIVRYRVWEKRYRRFLYDQHRYLRFPGVKHAVTLHRPKLEDAFVNLEIQTNTGTIYSEASSKTLGLGEMHTLETALKRFTRLVILGGPGAGKTTLLQHVVCVLCDPMKKARHKLLPIFAPLRRCPMNGETIVQHLTTVETGLLPAELIKTYPTGFFEHQLKRGRCFICFDGLDEVFDENDHVKAAQFVEATAAVYDKCTVVVTSRLAGWRNLLGSEFVRFAVRDLSFREIEGLVKRWFFSVIHEELIHNAPGGSVPAGLDSKSAGIASDHAAKMLRALESNRLGNIASTPLLLSLMCLLFYIRQDLPRRRVPLYGECIELLLENWDRLDKQLHFVGLPGLDHKIDLLSTIALHLFHCNATEIPVGELLDVVSEFLQGAKLRNEPRTLIEFIQERSGLLVEKALGVVGFTHLTFQEYLCALALKDDPKGVDFLIDRLAVSEAEEIILLFAGLSERADTMINALLVGFAQSGETRFVIAAGKAIPEARTTTLETKGKVTRVLSQLFDSSMSGSDLTALQTVLAGLGVEKVIIKSFGDYEILGEIGRGGMATVYKGREKTTQDPVALKVYHSIPEDPFHDATRGLRALQALRYPDMAAVRDFGWWEKRLFVAMDFVDGQNLQKIVDTMRGMENGELVPPESDSVMVSENPAFLPKRDYKEWVKGAILQVAHTVGHLHAVGLIHGDLKPSNIVWAAERAVLIDIGVDSLLSRLASDSVSMIESTQWRRLVGTWDYMSPERLEDHAASPVDDVYALIRVLEMLCTLGLQPLHDRTRVGAPRRPLWEPSADLRRLMKTTMYRDRSKRPGLDEFVACVEKASL